LGLRCDIDRLAPSVWCWDSRSCSILADCTRLRQRQVQRCGTRRRRMHARTERIAALHSRAQLLRRRSMSSPAPVDGHMRAYSTASGKVLWNDDMAKSFVTVNGVNATGGSIDSAGPTIAGGLILVNSAMDCMADSWAMSWPPSLRVLDLAVVTRTPCQRVSIRCVSAVVPPMGRSRRFARILEI
jgi:hypothetical protein